MKVLDHCDKLIGQSSRNGFDCSPSQCSSHSLMSTSSSSLAKPVEPTTDISADPTKRDQTNDEQFQANVTNSATAAHAAGNCLECNKCICDLAAYQTKSSLAIFDRSSSEESIWTNDTKQNNVVDYSAAYSGFSSLLPSSPASSPSFSSSQPPLPSTLYSSHELSSRLLMKIRSKLDIVQPRQQKASSKLKLVLTRKITTHYNKKDKSTVSSVISLTSFLLILAHICQIVLLPSLSSNVALAQLISNDEMAVNHANNEPLSEYTDNNQTMRRFMQAPSAETTLQLSKLQETESWRLKPEGMRDLRDARLSDKLVVNMSNVFEVMLKKRPFSKYWTVEQKWDDLFRRAMDVQGTVRQMMLKTFLRDIEYYSDLALSPQCAKDLKYIQSYVKQSSNFRWLAHMVDSMGKSEPGMLTGMLSNLGHPVQCIRVRAPVRPSNHSFDERFFEEQTKLLGERFRGKYCVASVRPVMPTRPTNEVISRFSVIMNGSLLSNISYTGEDATILKQRSRQMSVPASAYSKIDRDHLRLDQIPFESELYAFLIAQRNFMYSLPRFMGVCYPSSCTREDVRMSLQKTMDDQHQVVDIEFECEQEEIDAWDWFSTPRLLCYVILSLICGIVFLTSFTRYVLLSWLQIKRSRLSPNSAMAGLLNTLDMFSMDKCAGILFVKTKRASIFVDWTKVENNRSTAIDALRGFLTLVLVYSQMTVLGCLPVPFMWSKWSDSMFPFYRSIPTQFFININIWSESFYMISAYIISVKILENFRPKLPLNQVGSSTLQSLQNSNAVYSMPNFFTFVIKRYVRLVLPLAAFIVFNYVWPRLSNGFVLQDQANKLMKPCDKFGWTNLLMFYNHNPLNETCLWPSHVSASFFQLHLLSYPIIIFAVMLFHTQFKINGDYGDTNKQRKRLIMKISTFLLFGSITVLALFGAFYPALLASQQSLIVPFLIDYIDYDNYRRVIEWMVLPTYNHLTSYMLGLAIAFIIIKRKASEELQKFEELQWDIDASSRQFNQREGSSESIRSSSTQELHQQDGLTFKQAISAIHVSSKSHIKNSNRHFHISSRLSSSSQVSEQCDDHYDVAGLRQVQYSTGNGLKFAKSFFCVVLCVGSTLSSWYWNGLGQPMSADQTFWYVMLTKLCFCAGFAYLFHDHFATRRNSNNPWMITRFLVPIGRMSLSVFYVSWLVIWFDLLSSLYQWHPSHYFICEKYNEIIFLTLILAMFIYGAFEGIVKRIQYSTRLDQLIHDVKLSTTSKEDELTGSMMEDSQYSRFKMKPFEDFFNPCDKPSLAELKKELITECEFTGCANEILSRETNQSVVSKNKELSDNIKLNLSDVESLKNKSTTSMNQLGQDEKAIYSKSVGSAYGTTASAIGRDRLMSGNLSPSDRYKLNAELRANYSFASIGLYECAGATGDLSHLSTNDPQDQRQ